MEPLLEEVAIADDPAAWRELGFAVEDGFARVGSVGLRFVDGPGRGIAGWSLNGGAGAEIDGLPSLEPAGGAGPAKHPNGAVRIDHVVVLSDQLERTSGAFEAAGVRLRRIREAGEARQAFFRLGEVIVEVVSAPQVSGPAAFWGLMFVVEDIDRCAALLGDRVGEVHDAVQTGRRIAGVKKAAGAALPIAFMSE